MVKTLRAIIPVAGNGIRLRPLTEFKPKVLLEVAGKPVLDRILYSLSQNGIDEIVFIVGYMKDAIIKWTMEHYGSRFKLHFVEQKEQLGLGHAIYCAKEYLGDNEVLITLGDEIFSRHYTTMMKDDDIDNSVDAAVGTMIVDNPSHYGMIEVDKDGLVKSMIEKPEQFDGDLALAGAYYIRKGESLRNALETLLKQEKNGREYQLTDALQIMVDAGARISTFEVGLGYDCGRLESLLTSNRRILVTEHNTAESASIINSEIIQPCFIDEDVQIVDSTIGPYVSIGKSAKVVSCKIHDAIIESHASLKVITSSHGIYTKDSFLLER